MLRAGGQTGPIWRIAGVDEAGRGPLAGPVVAAAVILKPGNCPVGLDDSKKLSASRRERLARDIRSRSLACSVGLAKRDEIDRMNILDATLLAMQRAVSALPIRPDHVLVDGNRAPEFFHAGSHCSSECVIRGDATVGAISAASIIAKVHRDRLMIAIDRRYPNYGFARHKGYGTREHRDMLVRFGPCPEHRRSFAPLRLSVDRG